jgi:hypothetical protein
MYIVSHRRLVRVKCQILLYASLMHFSSPDDILGVHEDTRQGVVQALWNYVKVNQLQDKTDRRAVRADAALRPVSLAFS